MFDNKCDKVMKSEKAKEFIDGCMVHLTVEMSDHAKWQFREVMTHSAELAEWETEERMREKAHKIIKEMMEGVFQGNMPQNIADEFSQKLNEE